MCYAEPISADFFKHSWMNDIYEKPKRIELTERELIGLRNLKSMGNKKATQTLADYYFSKPIF